MEDIDWEKALEEIDEMLEDERYEFATDTLEGIKEWIYEREFCTFGQYDAIENIRNSAHD